MTQQPANVPDWIERDARTIRLWTVLLCLGTVAAALAVWVAVAPDGPQDAGDGILLGLGGSLGLVAVAFLVELRRHRRALRTVSSANHVEVYDAVDLLSERSTWPGRQAVRWALRTPAPGPGRWLQDFGGTVDGFFAFDSLDGRTRWFREAGSQPWAFLHRMGKAGGSVSVVVADDVLLWRSSALLVFATGIACEEPPITVRSYRTYTFHVLVTLASGAGLLLAVAALPGDAAAGWRTLVSALVVIGAPSYIVFLGIVRSNRRRERRIANESDDPTRTDLAHLMGQPAPPRAEGWSLTAHLLAVVGAYLVMATVVSATVRDETLSAIIGWLGLLAAGGWILGIVLRRRRARTSVETDATSSDDAHTR